MSEALPTVFFLTLSGGFQDAYTYVLRGNVFANAQTGNIIFFSTNLLTGQYINALKYLVPIVAFILGIFIAEVLRGHFSTLKKFHWRQLILLIEIALLSSVAFIPQEINAIANAIVSFVCALQIETFRKLKGKAFNSTMCIGNLRSGTENLYKYVHTKDTVFLYSSLHYFGIIAIFALGAGIGGILSSMFGDKIILISPLLLLISLLIMFIDIDKREEN